MAVTLEQVAKHAGVSTSTVSHILNGRDGYAPETRHRVLEATEALGYRPHTAARAVRRGRFGAIGIITSSDPDKDDTAIFLDGVLDALAGTGLNLVVARLPDAELAEPPILPRLLDELTVDGVLIAVAHSIPDGLIRAVNRHRIPAVWLNARFAADSVAYDNIAAAREAVGRLAALGHRRIGYLDVHWEQQPQRRRYGQDDRLAGYRAGIADAGLSEIVWRFDRGAWQPRELIDEIAARLAGPDAPTALVARANIEARAAYGAAMLAGLRVPGDLSILPFARGPLTSDTGVAFARMAIPAGELARHAVELLRTRIDHGGDQAAPQLVPIPFEPGDTLAPAPTTDTNPPEKQA